MIGAIMIPMIKTSHRNIARLINETPHNQIAEKKVQKPQVLNKQKNNKHPDGKILLPTATGRVTT